MSIHLFAGTVPANYDKYLGPYLFEPYAIDLEERLKNDQCRNVLELACGTGRVTRHLLNLLPPDGRLVATDLNPDMLKLAKEIVHDSRIQWQTADAQELSFADSSFDHVVCQYGVMFFPDKPRAFAEAYRVLKPSGKFIFNTWGSVKDNAHAAFVQDLMTDIFKENTPDFLKKGPYSFYDLDVIRSMMEEAGFTDIKLTDIQKTVIYTSVEDYINGFVDGSPLSVFLDSQPAGTREMVKEEARARMANGGSLERTMLAYVCEGRR